MANSILKGVCRAMDRIAPLRLAESWDNANAYVSLTTAVLEEAIAQDASVVLSYHPPIFKGLQSLTLKVPLQSSLLQCAAQGISIYSPHTALDSVWGGVNDWLAAGVLDGHVENGSIASLVGDKVGPAGVTEGGEGRLVTLNSPISMSVLQSRIKKQLKLSQSGHTNTERGYLPDLAAKLRHELAIDARQDSGLEGVEVIVSQKDQHPLEIV
ncbi:hypothetical protein H0H92_005645 [Tricholoma furcatifolium]|nr:hypothetical protein H0H92_005645 [Tricholoma furcatifolium]